MTTVGRRPISVPVSATLENAGPIALRELRRTLGSLLGAMPTVHRAVDLAEHLGIDRSLAWKVWRVSQGPDELPSPKHIPGRAAMDIFLAAASSRGVAPTLIEPVRECHTRLQGIIRRHAGDRASAEILLGQFTDEGRSRLEMQLRRDAFRAYSHFLGVRMRTRYQLDVVSPSGPEHMPSVARVRGYYGLQRTRAEARWVLSLGFVRQDAHAVGTLTRRPLDPTIAEGPATSVPILPRFCSPGELPLRRQPTDSQTVVDELAPGPIGETGAADIVTGELIAHVPRRATSVDRVGVHLRTPSERLCYDVLIHRDVAGGRPPVMGVYTTLNASTPQEIPEERDRVPVIEELRELGAADTAPIAVEVPRYAELQAWVFEQLRYDPRDYLLYRYSMRFPPVAIVIRATYPLAGA